MTACRPVSEVTWCPPTDVITSPSASPAPAADTTAAGPNGLRHFEQSLAALASAPLDPDAKVELLAIVDDYVFGHLLHAAELTERGLGSAAIQEFLAARLGSGDFPHLAALAGGPAVWLFPDAGRLAERFDYGLRLLLDGVAAELK